MGFEQGFSHRAQFKALYCIGKSHCTGKSYSVQSNGVQLKASLQFILADLVGTKLMQKQVKEFYSSAMKCDAIAEQCSVMHYIAEKCSEIQCRTEHCQRADRCSTDDTLLPTYPSMHVTQHHHHHSHRPCCPDWCQHFVNCSNSNVFLFTFHWPSFVDGCCE